MPITVEPKDGFLVQCAAFSSLFLGLYYNKFLESDFFANMSFPGEGEKEIVRMSNIGNPVMMQMMLYALIVVPKEMKLDQSNSKLECAMKKALNKEIGKLVVKEGTKSTYKKEKDGSIDYFVHIRNALAHCSCDFVTENGVDFVIFEDKYPTDEFLNKHPQKKQVKCTIKMRCGDVEQVMVAARKVILDYLKKKYMADKPN